MKNPMLLDRPAPHRWIPMLLIIYNFCANLANDIYLPSMPTLMHLYATTSSTLQLTMSAWFAGVALPQLFFGPLTDKIGRRPVLFAGGVCFLIATFVCALAPNIWVLIVARFFQGVGVCSLNVTTFSILIDLYTYKNRTRITNKITMVGIMAPLFGPILGGYILAMCGWQYNFVVVFLLALGSLIGLWYTLPESNRYLNPHALHVKNITKNYMLLARNKLFLKNLIPYCLLLGGIVVYLTAAPFIIIDKMGVAPQRFGYTQLPVFSAFILGALLLNTVREEAQLRWLLARGIALSFVGGCLMLIASAFLPQHLAVFIVPMLIYALGFSLCSSPLVSEVMSVVTSTKGSAAAFLGFGMASSCTLLSLLLGVIYDGSILSIACLLFAISSTAAAIYFIKLDDVAVPSEATS